MLTTAKVFNTGNSQAVRLPKAFRVNVAEMWITKNEVTGEISLKPKDDDQRQRDLDELFKMIREEPFSEDFIPPRSDEVRPNPFDDWAAPLPASEPKPEITTKRKSSAVLPKRGVPAKKPSRAAR